MTKNLKLAIFVAALCVFSTVYSKLMFSIYHLQNYEHFDHLTRVLVNKKSYHDRSLLRNIVFNCIRCFENEAASYYLLGTVTPFQLLVERMAFVILMTVVVQYAIEKKSFVKNCKYWQYWFAFYWVTFGILWLGDLKTAEEWSNGSLIKMLTWEVAMMFGYLIGDLLEDIIFGDMNAIGGLWHNWLYIWPPITVQIIGYAIACQYFTILRNDQSAVFAGIKKDSNPLIWRTQNFNEEISHEHDYAMLIASNMIFSIAAIYYTGNWVADCERQTDQEVQKQVKKKVE